MTHKREDIRKEIREEAPGLHGLGISPVFSVPDGYFEQFPAQVMNAILAESPEEEIAEFSRLSTVPRTSPFSVPDSYFGSLTSAIGNKKFEAPAGRIVRMGRTINLYKKCIIAAAIAGVISIGAILLAREYGQNSLDNQLALLSDQDMIDYLQYRTDDFDNENIFANASTDATADSLTSITIPDDFSEADLDAILEENLLKDVPIN